MNVLIDTGVWYAFCDPKDRAGDHDLLEELVDNLRSANVLAPWPVIYETIRTKFAKNGVALRRLESFLKRPKVRLVDDIIYRSEALELVFENALRKSPARPRSMVDCLLRLMLDDVDMKIDKFITFNAKDFYDVCGRRMIDIVQ